jgi:hypothetical protein
MGRTCSTFVSEQKLVKYFSLKLVSKLENTEMEIRCAEFDTLYQQTLALTSPTRRGRPVDIVRMRTKPRS